MKKFTTKLLMSIIAVAFAFVALGTSTYAWFTLNTQVSATGMQVTAKSNATYLLIGAADNASDKTASNTTIVAAYDSTENTQKKVYPTAIADATVVTKATAENAETTIEAGDWYTASNGKADNPTNDMKNYHEVTEGDKEYMLTYKVWLTLSADSENTTKKVKATFSKTSGDDAVSACVKINGEKLFVNGANLEDTTGATITFTKSTSIEVTIYMYIDGNSTNVYSDYINNQQDITGVATIAFDLVD